MSEITTIGLDLGKHVFHVHCIDAQGTTVLRKRLRRGQVLAFFSRIPRCVVGLEACATAHYWARELGALGHEVRLMPAQYVNAYIKRNKHDAADAEAICEAVQRPTMHGEPIGLNIGGGLSRNGPTGFDGEAGHSTVRREIRSKRRLQGCVNWAISRGGTSPSSSVWRRAGSGSRRCSQAGPSQGGPYLCVRNAPVLTAARDNRTGRHDVR